MKKSIIYSFVLLNAVLLFQSCTKRKGTDLLKFQGSWFLRINEIDYSDSLNPGKIAIVKGNEVLVDMTTKVMDLIKQGRIQAYDDSLKPLTYKKVCLNLINESLRRTIDTNKINEADMFNSKLVGVELNDSIFLDIEHNEKKYSMHSINLFIPGEFTTSGNQSVCKILFNDLKGKGLDTELKALEERKFARKEKIYQPDGTTTDVYTFYLTDAAGVEYYFKIPLEQVLANDHNIENSILHYFKDDLVDP